MIDLYNEKQLLLSLKDKIKTIEIAFDTKELANTLYNLSEEQNSEGFWNDVKKAQEVNKKISLLEKKIKCYENLLKKYNDLNALLDLIEELDEETEVESFRKDLKELDGIVTETSVEALLDGKYDQNNAILTLHAGAGGTEAQDWAEMLYRMYCRYAEIKGFSNILLDYQAGDEAGIKSVTFQLNGDYAYGFMNAEKGVHRLVRISPFDSNKRRHTSFASLEVMPEISDNDDIAINSDDLRIDTYRSGGAGGQHVNKTDSAIRITHLPTGIVVQCQNERSQIQNRETAMKMLKSKLLELKEAEQQQEQKDIKGELKKIEWGSQIRSYVFCPYTMVKDHRTGYENTNVNAVMDGDIEGFIIDYLTKK